MNYEIEYNPDKNLRLLFRYTDNYNLDHNSYNENCNIYGFTKLLYPMLLPAFPGCTRFVSVKILKVNLHYCTHSLIYTFKANDKTGWYELRCNISNTIKKYYCYSFYYFHDINVSKLIFESRINTYNTLMNRENMLTIHEDLAILDFFKPCENILKESLCKSCKYYSNQSDLYCAVNPKAEHRWCFECKDYSYENQPKDG